MQPCPLPVKARQAVTVGFGTVTFASGMCPWAEVVQTCSMVQMGPVNQHAASSCVSASGNGANRDQTQVP